MKLQLRAKIANLRGEWLNAAHAQQQASVIEDEATLGRSQHAMLQCNSISKRMERIKPTLSLQSALSRTPDSSEQAEV